MSAQLITTRDDWNQALTASAPDADFLQSWEWGEFQRASGWEPVRLRISADGFTGAVQGLRRKLLPGIFYWYFPRLILAAELWPELIVWSKNTNATWLRLESGQNFDFDSVLVLGKNFLSEPPRQPEVSWQLDLQKSAPELLAAMHAKTRYNINLAERKGVTVKIGADSAVFLKLMQETTARDGFAAHSPGYYQEMLRVPFVEQLTAYHNGEPLAAGLFTNYNKVYTYVHGASANHDRELMAPYALQWVGIQRGQALGAARYDFWGIAPPVTTPGALHTQTFHGYTWSTEHKLSGVTRFKAGFGGELVQYPRAVIVKHRPYTYTFVNFLQKIRRVI